MEEVDQTTKHHTDYCFALGNVTDDLRPPAPIRLKPERTQLLFYAHMFKSVLGRPWVWQWEGITGMVWPRLHRCRIYMIENHLVINYRQSVAVIDTSADMVPLLPATCMPANDKELR